ncbi:hypothetical protein Tco_0381349 [Tanacetum coccineum]
MRHFISAMVTVSIHAKVMDAPTIPVFADSSKGNFRDTIDIGVDVVHQVPVAAVAFPAVTIVTTLSRHGEAIRGIHVHLQGCAIGRRLILEVIEKAGSVAYKLELPQELSRAHHTFHVSNLKKCYANKPLDVPLDGLHIDDKLYFVEEPVEIMNREVKRLKQIRIPIVKVPWNSRRGSAFTWEREDQFWKKYPHLFKNLTVVKCRVSTLEDKAHLTGEDYNTPCFQVIL